MASSNSDSWVWQLPNYFMASLICCLYTTLLYSTLDEPTEQNRAQSNAVQSNPILTKPNQSNKTEGRKNDSNRIQMKLGTLRWKWKYPSWAKRISSQVSHISSVAHKQSGQPASERGVCTRGCHCRLHTSTTSTQICWSNMSVCVYVGAPVWRARGVECRARMRLIVHFRSVASARAPAAWKITVRL